MDRIKRLSTQILNEYQDKFGTDFFTNKQFLNEISIIRSKSLKNKIAGYITKILKRKQKFEDRKQELIENEKLENPEQIKEATTEPLSEPTPEPVAEPTPEPVDKTLAEEILNNDDTKETS